MGTGRGQGPLLRSTIWVYGFCDMVHHTMKTTVEITDDLLLRAKALAASRKTTVRALIERGLRQVLKEDQPDKPFKLRDASVRGNGLQSEFKDASWAEIREASYRDVKLDRD